MGGWIGRTLAALRVRNGLVALATAMMMVATGVPGATAADGIIRISSTKPALVKIAKGKPRTIKTEHSRREQGLGLGGPIARRHHGSSHRCSAPPLLGAPSLIATVVRSHASST